MWDRLKCHTYKHLHNGSFNLVVIDYNRGIPGLFIDLLVHWYKHFYDIFF
jgi:hypothetical protein